MEADGGGRAPTAIRPQPYLTWLLLALTTMPPLASCESEQITRNKTIKKTHLPQASVLLLPPPRRCRPRVTYMYVPSAPRLPTWQTAAENTETTGLSLPATVCLTGGKGAGTIWTREGQHHFDQVFVVGRKMMLAQLWLWWLCGAPKKERKGTVIREKCVTSTVYLHTQPTYDTSLFSFGETFFVGTSILCQHLIHDVATCLLHFG